ncbi:hypothetical protein M4V62_28290 [Streptomyces durmitorensis]|uniref:Integral membrane protein n=1 Tax=Streptomyces durmitorensis TaxID=319947 RepID=A0ABY4Q0F9_9ACTN|nr:hypothetical protein [Streptomyces durmitorensis]UQT58656.1 hypothetical protein M4V62_28290 [Streptomyces durmitorensis]
MTRRAALAHDDERDRPAHHPQAPWWWGMGPAGAVLLIAAGIAWALWAFLGSGVAGGPMAGYQSSKIVAIGLVLLGTIVLERLRSRRTRADEAEEQQEEEQQAEEQQETPC